MFTSFGGYQLSALRPALQHTQKGIAECILVLYTSANSVKVWAQHALGVLASFVFEQYPHHHLS